MDMRSSMSLSFVVSYVWVGVLSFVSVSSMSSVISFNRIQPESRVLFPKLSCLQFKSPVTMALPRPKQNPSMISLEGSLLGQYNVEMYSVPVVVCKCLRRVRENTIRKNRYVFYERELLFLSVVYTHNTFPSTDID